MSIVELSYKELAIKDPKNHLNNYCIQLSKLPGMEITKVCKTAKDEIGNEIPSYCFTDFVENRFKNQSQLSNSKQTHKEEMTKDGKISAIAKWLKKQPKDMVDSFYAEAQATAEPEIQMGEYLKK